MEIILLKPVYISKKIVLKINKRNKIYLVLIICKSIYYLILLFN